MFYRANTAVGCKNLSLIYLYGYIQSLGVGSGDNNASVLGAEYFSSTGTYSPCVL